MPGPDPVRREAGRATLSEDRPIQGVEESLFKAPIYANSAPRSLLIPMQVSLLL